MIRRRRPAREINFSFDSFLDVVANVVGIIIRLILVVWVGARSYTGMQMLSPTKPAVQAEAAEEADPLQDELENERRRLADAQARLLEQLRHLEQVHVNQLNPSADLAALAQRRQVLEREQAGIDRTVAERDQVIHTTALSAAELRERCKRLSEELQALEKMAPAKKVYRYPTPVSHPVQSEELLFECRAGRITFIDIATLLQDVRQGIKDKGEQLRTLWQVSDIVGPVGPFRLRYLVERERNLLDTLASVAPDSQADFRYAVTRWELEPVGLVRGESVEQALSANSEFRHIVDALDAQHTAVTFFVYPDSFAAYRQVRDYLYGRDVLVAGRPLPDGAPIASSRQGSRSHGQ